MSTGVVEGATEAALLPVASSVLEQSRDDYTHLDLAGVSVLPGRAMGSVPRYRPIFKTLGKSAFAFVDKQAAPWTADQPRSG